MNQTSFSFLIVLFFFIGVQHILYAQSDSLVSPTKKAFIEADNIIHSARDFNQLNPPPVFILDTVGYSIRSSDAFELQFRYTQDFTDFFSWYGGISFGRSGIQEVIDLRESILIIGSGGSSSPFESFTVRGDDIRKAIHYATLIGGLRVSTGVFKK